MLLASLTAKEDKKKETMNVKTAGVAKLRESMKKAL